MTSELSERSTFLGVVVSRVIAGLLWVICLLPASGVTPGNTPPTLSVDPLIEGSPNRSTLPVIVTVGDAETPVELLRVSVGILPAARENPRLLKPAGIALTGEGGSRSLVLTPEPEEYGFVMLEVSVTDAMDAKAVRNVRYLVEPFVRSIPIGTSPGEKAAWADVDNDGRLDWLWEGVWFKNLGGTNFGRAGATLRRFTGGSALALGDPDSNGTVDYAVLAIESNLPRTLVLTNSPAAGYPLHRFRPLAEDLIPGYFGEVVSWADFDLDGDVDLFALGSTSRRDPGRIAANAWRNDGQLRFVSFPSPLPPMLTPAMAWTDFDGDGDPDVLVVGQTGPLTSSATTQLLLNDGIGGFAASGVSLPPVIRGSAAWGDFDNDGLADLVLGGLESVSRGVTNRVRLFRHLPNGEFAEAAELDGVEITDIAVADITNDGLLDLIYYGQMPAPQLATARVYLNRGGWRFDEVMLGDRDADSPIRTPFAVGEMNGDGRLDLVSGVQFSLGTAPRANHVPGAPTRLRSTVEGDRVLLEWDAAVDADQPGGLTYNVRVGRARGGGDVVSPLAMPDGTRLIAESGNAFQALRRRLRGLSAGAYYWSVQAVDHTFAGGAFAEEAMFVVGAAPDVLGLTAVGRPDGVIVLSLTASPVGAVVIEQSEDLVVWTPWLSKEVPEAGTSVERPIGASPSVFFRLRRSP